VTTRIAIPSAEVAVTLDSRPLLTSYGRVTGMAYDNGGSRLSIRLHDGTRLVLAREGDDWILGPDGGEDLLAVTKLCGPDGRMTAAAHEAIDGLWRAACSVVDQFAAPVVEAIADDLAWLLDRAMTQWPC